MTDLLFRLRHAQKSALVDAAKDGADEIERLRAAGKALVRALRFSSEWGNAVADMEKLVGEYEE